MHLLSVFVSAQAAFGHGWSTLLQACGVQARGVALPERVSAGPMRQCFANAGQAVMSDPGLHYCEGYAVAAGLFPIEHAWCMDGEGRFIDPTWEDAEATEYLGVVFDREFSSRLWSQTQQWAHWGEMAPQALLDAPLLSVLAEPSLQRLRAVSAANPISPRQPLGVWLRERVEASTRAGAVRARRRSQTQ